MRENTSMRTEEIIHDLEVCYKEVKGIHRELRLDDRIAEDLHIDSLATVEMLLVMEDRYGLNLLDDPRSVSVGTVRDLVRLLDERRAEAE